MSNFVTVGKENIRVDIVKSERAMHMRIKVKQDGSVVAVQPPGILLSNLLSFIELKIAWIQKHVSFFAKQTKVRVVRKKTSSKEYIQYKKHAALLVHERLKYFNQFYGFSYNRITIKNQRSRWGSCSSKGNLNFSYKIIFLTPEAQDYLIVHELCHLKELNHSVRFWNLVAQQIPNYQRISTALRQGKFV